MPPVHQRLTIAPEAHLPNIVRDTQGSATDPEILNQLRERAVYVGTASECISTNEDFLYTLGEKGINISGEIQVYFNLTTDPLVLDKQGLGSFIENHRGNEDATILSSQMDWIVVINSGDVYVTDLSPKQSYPSLSDNLIASIIPHSERRVEIEGTLYSNYSETPLGLLLNLIPRDLQADEIVFMPDVNPGKAPLPTGTAVLTRDPNWRRYAISDCGCGMQLIRTNLSFDQFKNDFPAWDELGRLLQKNKGGLGDLGGGNHFVDAIVNYEDESVSILIHTGSRLESGLVDHLVDSPGKFESEFERIVKWARENRDSVREAVEKLYGTTELVLDLHHNSFDMRKDGSVLIRKGVVEASPGSLTILPSHMTGDVSLLKGMDRVKESLNSLAHGTGRAMSRAAAKEQDIDFESIRRAIYIPPYIQNESIKTEAPHVYRSLDRCLQLMGDLVEEQSRFAVVAYLGRL